MAFFEKVVFLMMVCSAMIAVHGAPRSYLLEAERARNVDAESFKSRGRARGFQTVWLHNMNDSVSLTLCLPEDDVITVERVRFSTDGAEKNVTVFVNDEEVGSFNTSYNSNYGKNWNQFQSQEGNFTPVAVSAGQVNISVVLTGAMDEYGIEIDDLKLSFDSSADLQDLLCEEEGETTASTTDVTEVEAATGETKEDDGKETEVEEEEGEGKREEDSEKEAA